MEHTDTVIVGSSWYVSNTEELCLPLLQWGGDGGIVVIVIVVVIVGKLVRDEGTVGEEEAEEENDRFLSLGGGKR
jgi:hypothetical protein